MMKQGDTNMSKTVALNVAGVVFLLAALVHMTRLFTHFQIILGNHMIPTSASLFGFIVALFLSIWMFSAAKSKQA
jgi:hypothetical protein